MTRHDDGAIDADEKRREAFAALLARYDMTPDDYDDDDDAEENPRPYLEGRRPCSPWVCVTFHQQRYFMLPQFEEADAAELRAVEYVTDDLWEEAPVAVVNLDTGETRRPDWHRLPWVADRNAATLDALTEPEGWDGSEPLT